jgi:hypothetical protein
MKLKEIDLQAYPFCEPKYKDVVNVYPPSKIPPYLDKSLEGFNYTFLTKVITDIKDVKYDDYTKMKKHMKCRVSNTDRMFSIRGTLKPLTVPTVGGTLSKNSVYLDYKFSIECLIPQANIWVPRWLITAMPTPEKFSKLYKFSKLDDKSIKNIWNKKAFEFKSPIYKVGNLSQQLILKGEIEGDKCTKYFTETECSQAYRTKDIQSIKTLEESSPFDCEEEKTPETKKDACQPEGGIVDEWACEEQKEREKKEKESSSTTSGDQENKTDEPVPGESLGGEKNTDSSNKKKNNDPPDDW